MGVPDGCDPGSEEESGTGLVAEGECQGPARAPCVLWVLVASALGGPVLAARNSLCALTPKSAQILDATHTWPCRGLRGWMGLLPSPHLAGPQPKAAFPLMLGRGLGEDQSPSFS